VGRLAYGTAIAAHAAVAGLAAGCGE
jgi:hypothetical protein